MKHVLVKFILYQLLYLIAHVLAKQVILNLIIVEGKIYNQVMLKNGISYGKNLEVIAWNFQDIWEGSI